jgi:hypothetical protein
MGRRKADKKEQKYQQKPLSLEATEFVPSFKKPAAGSTDEKSSFNLAAPVFKPKPGSSQSNATQQPSNNGLSSNNTATAQGNAPII